jgi:hypothetical protein
MIQIQQYFLLSNIEVSLGGYLSSWSKGSPVTKSREPFAKREGSVWLTSSLSCQKEKYSFRIKSS